MAQRATRLPYGVGSISARWIVSAVLLAVVAIAGWYGWARAISPGLVGTRLPDHVGPGPAPARDREPLPLRAAAVALLRDVHAGDLGLPDREPRLPVPGRAAGCRRMREGPRPAAMVPPAVGR